MTSSLNAIISLRILPQLLPQCIPRWLVHPTLLAYVKFLNMLMCHNLEGKNFLLDTQINLSLFSGPRTVCFINNILLFSVFSPVGVHALQEERQWLPLLWPCNKTHRSPSREIANVVVPWCMSKCTLTLLNGELTPFCCVQLLFKTYIKATTGNSPYRWRKREHPCCTT